MESPRRLRCSLPFICLVALVLFAAPSSAGEVRLVPRQYATITEAIDVAHDGDIIRVGRGTFSEAPISFAGKRIRLESQYGPEETILDGRRQNRIIEFSHGETNQTVLSGFTLKNGQVRGSGGAVLCVDASPTIENCIFVDNRTTMETGPGRPWKDAYGGALAATGGAAPQIVGCTFRNNRSITCGGAIHALADDPLRVTDCVFTGNESPAGGGVYLRRAGGGTVVVEGCTFTGNRGGGIVVGAVAGSSGTVRLERCRVEGNHDGGIKISNYSTEIVNCIVRDNVQGNSWEVGGGIQIGGQPQVRIEHSTIVDNQAPRGGGIWDCRHGDTAVVGCIVWGNGEDQIGVGTGDGTLDVRYCDVEGGFPGFGTFEGDPLFVDAAAGGFSLGNFSPCIDGGDPDSKLATDFDGNPRPLGAGTDVGAYECEGQGNRPPLLHGLGVSESYGPPPFEVAFTIEAEDEEPGLTYEIDFGDGRRDKNRTGEPFTHLFAQLGVYEVTARVRDAHGCTAIETMLIRATHSRIPGGWPTIQSALDNASDGDVIELPDGTYQGRGNYDLDFDGKAITLTSENGPDACIIDCGLRGRAFHFHRGEGRDSVISGLTIINASESFAEGGAILCHNASPTIEDCRFIECRASSHGLGRGGAISCFQNAAPMIRNCYFHGCVAGQAGGAIACWDAGSIWIEDCTFTANVAITMNGGAIDYVGEKNPIIKRCLIEGNGAARHGGGIHISTEGTPQIHDSIIRDNLAGQGAGGICFGGWIDHPPPAKLWSCIISGNRSGTAEAPGNIPMPFDVPEGAAIELRMCEVDARYCTLVANDPSSDDGAAVAAMNLGAITFHDSIIWGTTSGKWSVVEPFYAGASHAGCAIHDLLNPLMAIGDDPRFVDEENGDYRLSADSPCLDAGYANGPPHTDIGGNPRPAGPGRHIGAYHGCPDPATPGCTLSPVPPPPSPPDNSSPPPPVVEAVTSPLEEFIARIAYHELWASFEPGMEAVFEARTIDPSGDTVDERITVRLGSLDPEGAELMFEAAMLARGKWKPHARWFVFCSAKEKRGESKHEGKQELEVKKKVYPCEVHGVPRRNVGSETRVRVTEWRHAPLPGGLVLVQVRVEGPASAEGEFRLVDFK
jgi:hypothetical protein